MYKQWQKASLFFPVPRTDHSGVLSLHQVLVQLMYYINTLYTEQVMSRKKEKKVFESSVKSLTLQGHLLIV